MSEIEKFLEILFSAPSSPISASKAMEVRDWWDKAKIQYADRINACGADGWISVDGYDGDDVVDLWCVAKDCQFRGADFRLIDGVWISENSDLEISRHFGNVGVTATHFMINPKPPKVAE